MYGYNREKLHVNHFLELKGQILAAPLNFKEGSLNTEEVFSNYTPPFY